MNNNIFLLENILSTTFQENLTVDEKRQINTYLHQMETGPADGNMDSDWQKDGNGYYVHLHILKDLIRDEKKFCIDDIEKDAETWLCIRPDNHMVRETLNQLQELKDEYSRTS